jgi:hypothetical protein
MAKKMYYTEEEATAKLAVTVEQLNEQVAAGKLRVFHDGPRRMFKAGEIDALVSAAGAAPAPTPADTGEIELVEADDSVVSAVSAAAPAPPAGGAPPAQDDTVITAEGMSIFDDADLDIESADPMAKTSITASMEDQISLESTGSGSGLLDLTRESDDTSLGAEVLDHIDMEGALDTSLQGEPAGATASYAAPAVAAAMAPAETAPVAAADPMAGVFSGLLVGCCVVTLLLAAVMLSAISGIVPGFLDAMKSNLMIVLGACVAVMAVSGAVGFFVGSSAATKRAAATPAES